MIGRDDPPKRVAPPVTRELTRKNSRRGTCVHWHFPFSQFPMLAVLFSFLELGGGVFSMIMELAMLQSGLDDFSQMLLFHLTPIPAIKLDKYRGVRDGYICRNNTQQNPCF